NPNDTDIRAELGQHYVRLGQALEVLAARDDQPKREELARAVEAYEAGERHLAAVVGGADADSRVYTLRLTNCRAKLSLLRARPDDLPADSERAIRESLSALRDALESVTREQPVDAAAFPYHLLLVNIRIDFGKLLLQRGNATGAAEQFRQALRDLDEFP